MTKLKPGDRIVCCLKDGRFISPYSTHDEEKEFEIIALDFRGYFLYVPESYGLSGTSIVTSASLCALKIDKRFLGCPMIYVSQSMVYRIKEVLDGMTCSSCKEFYKYSEPNQENGTMVCWGCRAYPLYR